MRILGIGECNDLAAMYAGMQARGHDVKVFVRDEASHGVHAGMLTRTLWQKIQHSFDFGNSGEQG